MRNGEVCVELFTRRRTNYFHYLRDWKGLLNKQIKMWMEEKHSLLDQSNSTWNPLRDKWRTFNGGSVKDLISLIRDQDEHYSN